MNPNTERREGFALAVALVAMVIIGALVAGVFFATTQEYRVSRNTVVQERALTAAEDGQTRVLSSWNTTWNTAPVGFLSSTSYATQVGAAADVRLMRLNEETYLAVSEGRASGGGRRRTASVIRLDMPDLRTPAVITTSSTTNIAGTAAISGVDATSPGWSCPAAGPTRGGVANDNMGDVTSSGTCSGFTCVVGNPPVLPDSAAGEPETYNEWGGTSYATLAAEADHVYPFTSSHTSGSPYTGHQRAEPFVSGGTCATGNDPANSPAYRNWGEPWRGAASLAPACETYFPIMHFSGPSDGWVRYSAGRGQGIMLVDGNLQLRGNAEFHGLIIVKGSVRVEGTGVKVYGAIMAANETCAQTPCNVIQGTPVLQYSRCALLEVFRRRTKPELAKHRAWADMF